MRPGVLYGFAPRCWSHCPECDRPGLLILTDLKGGFWYDSHDAYRNGLNTGRPCPRSKEPALPEVRDRILTQAFELLLNNS